MRLYMRITSLVLIYITMSFVVLTSCSTKITVPEGCIIFRVVNTQGSPLINADVSYHTNYQEYNSEIGRTDISGNVVFKYPTKSERLYNFRIEHGGTIYYIDKIIGENDIGTIVELKLQD